MTPLFIAKLIGGALLIGALTTGVLYINHVRTEAARVPGLEAQITNLQALHARDDSEAAKAALQIVANMAARAQADQDLEKWNNLKGEVLDGLKGLVNNAAASKNPSCFPTARERELWNNAIKQLTAQSGD